MPRQLRGGGGERLFGFDLKRSGPQRTASRLWRRARRVAVVNLRHKKWALHDFCEYMYSSSQPHERGAVAFVSSLNTVLLHVYDD